MARRLKTSRLDAEPCAEDVNYRHPRQLDGAQFRSLLSCAVGGSASVGPPHRTDRDREVVAGAGAGAQGLPGRLSCVVSAGGKAVPRLGEAQADGSLGKLLPSLARVDVLVVDDFAMNPLEDHERRLFLEICDDRYRRRSTVLTSQLPVDKWHKQIGDPTIADSILDRLVHNAYRFDLSGESMRKKQGGRS